MIGLYDQKAYYEETEVMDASRGPSPLSDIPGDDDNDEHRSASPLSDIPVDNGDGAEQASLADSEVNDSSTSSTLSEGEILLLPLVWHMCSMNDEYQRQVWQTQEAC